MANCKNFIINTLLNSALVNTAYTGPSPLFIALYTAAPSASAGGTEVTGGDYTRGTVAYSVSTAQTTANVATVTFPVASAGWGTVSGWAITDALTSGSQLFFGSFSTAKVINTGNQFIVGTGQSVFTLS